MTTALEPGWYMDPYGDDRSERYHDGREWSTRTRRTGSVEEIVEPPVHLRSTAVRVLITVVAIVVFLALCLAPSFVSALAAIKLWWEIGVLVLLFASAELTRPMVTSGDRFYGFRSLPAVIWRLTLLPYRDAPADADDPRWRRIPYPGRPESVLYVRRR